MEGLRKLGEVQRMLCFMESFGISSNDNDSDRFLADFLLFMVQPCGMLNIEKRCHLIFEHLPKISVALLEQALLWVSEGDCQQSCSKLPTQLCLDNKRYLWSPKNYVKDMAMIGLDAMQRANSTLEDFCRSYFLFHGMDVNNPQSVFRFLPILSFTESYIYQLDTWNEEISNLSVEDVSSPDRGPKIFCDVYKAMGNPSVTNEFLEAFRSDVFGPLVLLLEHLGLLTERIRTELRCGVEYWALERKLCHALMRKKEISIEDVMRAIHLKSFDYRVLNLLLYQLRGKQVNDLHMEFLSISEFLVEVSDDLFDYEEDVVQNNFNIFRMFVALYGASVAPSMLVSSELILLGTATVVHYLENRSKVKCISEAEEKYECLSKTLDPYLYLNYSKRCEEATKEGGKMSGHTFGTWNMPVVIADEELYRSHLSSSESLVPPH